MKQLLIALKDEKEVFVTPDGVDGDKIHDLMEYHVSYFDGRRKTVRRPDIEVFFTHDNITGIVEGWNEQMQIGGEYGTDDEQMQEVWTNMKSYAVGTIDDGPAPSQANVEAPEAENGYFMGAYHVGYVYWTNEEDFKAAVKKNNPHYLKPDGTIEVKAGSLDRSKAFYCSSEGELHQAIKQGKVYAYLVYSQQLFLPDD